MCTASKRHMDSAFQVSPVMKVISALGEVIDILKVFSYVCYNTQAVPKFQVMNFLYITLLTFSFLKWLESF